MDANVDQAELRKFSDMAARWWDPQGPMRPLHEMNPVRLEWINRLAALAGKRVLDVGCGAGVLAEAMAACGAEVTGIDMAGKALKVAQLHALESGATGPVHRGRPLRRPLLRGRAATTSSPVWRCSSTCREPEQTVRACATLARPGGWVFFSTLNRNPKSFALAIVGAEYVLNLLPARHARVREVHQAERIDRVTLARPGSSCTN